MAKPKGKVALVTGASSGIGEATAERLAKAGYKVYGTSRRGAQAGKRSFEMLPLDVTSDESVEAAVSDVMRRDGRIDLLVNNAGFGVAPAGAEESSIDQARSIFETNFFGLIRMTRAVVPHMRRQGSGRIINIGSVLGFLPMPYGALYAATKHAVEGYSESLDHELRTRGIRVWLVPIPAYRLAHAGYLPRDQRSSLLLVERRISSDSLGSLTARASTSAPTSEARVASASSSRWRCLIPEPIRLLSQPAMPLTPAVYRSRAPRLWRDISQHKAAKGQPLPGSSRCAAERYSET
jgi:NAD(P)-dependent dehydrogenase (short-subunit alcohol dehydrogenase family)